MTTEPWTSVEDVAVQRGVPMTASFRGYGTRGVPVHKNGPPWMFTRTEGNTWMLPEGAFESQTRGIENAES
jgi:hypothetical protein